MNLIKTIASLSLGLIIALLVLNACRRQQTPEATTLTLKLVHGPELRSYLSSMREQFYLANPTLNNGMPVRIELISEMGVTAAKRLANGEIKNDAWIAPSSSLVEFTNSSTVNLGAEQNECLKLFETPIIAAIKSDQAVLLGVDQEKHFSWKKVMEGALSQHDEKAPFLIGFSHAQPRSSTTGLGSLIQLVYMVTGRESLGPSDLRSTETISTLKAFENIVFSYPLSESYLLSNIMLSTPQRVRLGITTEQQLLQFRRQHPEEDLQLTALYPEEGSYVEDYHLCTSAADWVTPAHRAGLKILYNFMASETAQKAAGELGFRPVIVKPSPKKPAPAGARLAEAAPPALPHVSGEVVAGLLDLWPSLRRQAALILVMDGSGSMEGDALEAGKEQFRKLLAQTSENDLKALISFASNVQVVGNISHDTARIIGALDTVQALGGSAIYDAVKKAYEIASNPQLGAYRKTIVVYTDGDDHNSEISLGSLIGLGHQKSTEMDINLVIVAVNREGANFSDLERFAQASNGTLRISALIDIESVFQEIAKSF